jgi:hypothetical protein
MKKRLFQIAMLAFAVYALDVCFGQEWQRAQYENGRQVVACSRKGRVSGFYYFEYVCARGNDMWMPVPSN